MDDSPRRLVQGRLKIVGIPVRINGAPAIIDAMSDIGVYETHITLDLRPDAAAGLREWCARRGLKLTEIRLARGTTPYQPMVTWHGGGTFAEHRARAEAVAEDLDAAGFTVLRLKIETTPHGAQAPRTEGAAARLPAGQYFEHHVKLLHTPGTALPRLAPEHNAHISWNTRRARPDGRHERFVTQRCHRVAADEAARRLQALLDDLHEAGWLPVEVEREFVCHDSSPSVDMGWLPADTADTGEGTTR